MYRLVVFVVWCAITCGLGVGLAGLHEHDVILAGLGAGMCVLGVVIARLWKDAEYD